MLVIELDGYTHNFEEVVERDVEKQEELEKIGLTVLRFADVEVMHDINNVLRTIENYILDFEEREGDTHPLAGRP